MNPSADTSTATKTADPKEVSAAAAVAAQWRKARVQPIRELDPIRIAFILDEYARGDLQQAALLWDKIERRDDKVRVVVAKRKHAVSSLAWEILTERDTPEAAAHKAALEYFYGNLRVSDVMRRDMQGEVPTLIRHILGAKGHGYAAAEVLWKSGKDADGHDAYTAELLRVPLWFFEAKTGQLRLLPTPTAADGTDLPRTGWLVATSEDSPLHEATCIAYLYKSAPLRDWLFWCEKFGLPWIHGKTDATMGSPEWNLFASAIGALGNDSQIITNIASEVDVKPIVSSGQAPHPDLVDRMDRAIVQLWLGGDLNVMSKGNALGSNAQADNLDELRADDAAFVAEQLSALSRQCLENLFGAGTVPLARFALLPPAKVDSERQLSVIRTATELGVPIGTQYFRDTFSLPAPSPDEDLLTKPTPTAGVAAGAGIHPFAAPQMRPSANAAPLSRVSRELAAIWPRAIREDWQLALNQIDALDVETDAATAGTAATSSATSTSAAAGTSSASPSSVLAIHGESRAAGTASADASYLTRLLALRDSLPALAQLAHKTATAPRLLSAAFSDAEEEDAETDEIVAANSPQRGPIEFEESKHPRGDDGQFVASDGSTANGLTKDTVSKLTKQFLQNYDKVTLTQRDGRGAFYIHGMGYVDLPYGNTGRKNEDYKFGKGIRHFDREFGGKHSESNKRFVADILIRGKNKESSHMIDGKPDPTKKERHTENGKIIFGKTKNFKGEDAWKIISAHKH